MNQINPYDANLIERYFDGLLNATEMSDFKQRLVTDTDFKALFDTYQDAINAIHLAGQDEITALLKAEQAKLKASQAPTPLKKAEKKPFILRGWLAAASIAMFALAAYWFVFREKPVQLSPLVAAYFKPYPAIGITRGGDEQNIRLEALKTYAGNDYKHAIPLLQKAFDVEQDSLLLLYKSIAHIGNGEATQAQPILESLQNHTSLTETAQWYLALAYIESKNKEKALPLLQNTLSAEGSYQQAAQELLEKIK
jgi:predicted Zn-dependent protease